MIVPITKPLLLVPESVSRFHNHFPMVYVRPSSILSFPDLQLALPSRDHAMSFDTSSDHSQGLHGRACASMQKRWVCVSFVSSLYFPKCGVLAPLSINLKTGRFCSRCAVPPRVFKTGGFSIFFSASYTGTPRLTTHTSAQSQSQHAIHSRRRHCFCCCPSWRRAAAAPKLSPSHPVWRVDCVPGHRCSW